jgi:hypothetical protein
MVVVGREILDGLLFTGGRLHVTSGSSVFRILRVV